VNETPPQQQKQALSKAAVAGFVLSILGLCILPAAIAAIVLGGVGIAKTGKGLGGRVLAIVALCLGGVGFFSSLGISAAVAIPSFIRYVRETKKAEATQNVTALFLSATAQYHAERMGPAGALLPQTFGLSLPRTPPEVSCAEVPWPVDAHPGWAAIGFAPSGPLLFRYELEVSPDGQAFVARALGDLNCDGVPEVFERGGRAAGGQIVSEPEVRELEVPVTTHDLDWD